MGGPSCGFCYVLGKIKNVSVKSFLELRALVTVSSEKSRIFNIFLLIQYPFFNFNPFIFDLAKQVSRHVRINRHTTRMVFPLYSDNIVKMILIWHLKNVPFVQCSSML